MTGCKSVYEEPNHTGPPQFQGIHYPWSDRSRWERRPGAGPGALVPARRRDPLGAVV